MGMPVFTKPTEATMREALLAVMGTIADGELSAAMLIEAEALKLAKLIEVSSGIEDEDKASQLLINADESVSNLVKQVAAYENGLRCKLKAASENISIIQD